MKDIMVKIAGQQFGEDGLLPQVELITEAKLYERGSALYLQYDESELSGMPGCRTRLRFEGDTLRMTRIGKDIPLHTEIKFEKGVRFEGYYDTPYGAVEMEVLTNSIKNEIDAKKGCGKANVDYHIALKGLFEARSLLDIEVLN